MLDEERATPQERKETGTYRGPFKFTECDGTDVYLESDDNVERGQVTIRYYKRKSKYFEISHTYDWLDNAEDEDSRMSRRFDSWDVPITEVEAFLLEYFVPVVSDDLRDELKEAQT